MLNQIGSEIDLKVFKKYRVLSSNLYDTLEEILKEGKIRVTEILYLLGRRRKAFIQGFSAGCLETAENALGILPLAFVEYNIYLSIL